MGQPAGTVESMPGQRLLEPFVQARTADWLSSSSSPRGPVALGIQIEAPMQRPRHSPTFMSGRGSETTFSRLVRLGAGLGGGGDTTAVMPSARMAPNRYDHALRPQIDEERKAPPGHQSVSARSQTSFLPVSGGVVDGQRRRSKPSFKLPREGPGLMRRPSSKGLPTETPIGPVGAVGTPATPST